MGRVSVEADRSKPKVDSLETEAKPPWFVESIVALSFPRRAIKKDVYRSWHTCLTQRDGDKKGTGKAKRYKEAMA